MNYCGVDLETASELDIADVGAHQYFQHPSTHILCLAYGSLKEQKIWRPGQSFPPELRHAAAKGWTFVAHNAQFDGTGWKYLLPEEPFPQRWLCTATRASANGLPRGLDEACHALGLPGKDPEGQKALKVMMKPDRKTGLFIDTPELRKDVEHYCGIDLVRMWQIFNATKPLSEDEQAFFDLDWEINARGFAVDANGVDRIIGRLEEAYAELSLRVFDTTDGEIGNVNSLPNLSRWLADNGMTLPNYQAPTLTEVLETWPDVSEKVRKVIKLRKLSSMKSPSKFKAFRQRGMREGDLLIQRDVYVVHGAHTGRHAAKGVQGQNMKRECATDLELDILMNDPLPDIRLLIGEPLEIAGKAVRPMVTARSNKKLLIGDFSKIETCVLFALAMEKRGLQMLRNDEDLYCDLASVIYGRKIIKKDENERQLGKQGILGCGYGVGKVTFQATCKKYGMDVQLDMCDKVVSTYRSVYSSVDNLWRQTNITLNHAIGGFLHYERCPQVLGPLKFAANDDQLVIVLPSGRKLRYQKPRMINSSRGNDDSDGQKIIQHHSASRNIKHQYKPSYMREDPKTRQWIRYETWGGHFVENVVQAIANDLQREAMLRLRDAGFNIVMHSHDEIVCEGDEGELETFGNVMAFKDRTLQWAEDMQIPIKVDLKATKVYRKAG